MTKQEIWTHFNRMQKAIIASDCQTSRKEFFAQSIQQQRQFYNWLCSQSGMFLAGPYWA